MNRKISPETFFFFFSGQMSDLLRLNQSCSLADPRTLEALLESDLYISLVLTKSTLKKIILFLKGRIIML